jgi:YidC/Oxa1 family membrane protein insertase
MSTAKMKVLKPQIDEINNRIPKEKAMERQKAVMALYKKVGVNPMGGCLPMLLQFPILIAMFRFFPASIELRHQSFLWADDLSSYDSILDLPFSIPFYGDHVSLFTLLMTLSTLLYTKMQNDMNPQNSQMAGMKTMMYIMPVMFMFMLNSYSAGLTYYYFLANMITFGQMFFIKRMINEEEILRKLETAKARPVKKSKFQQRLEEAARKRQMK